MGTFSDWKTKLSLSKAYLPKEILLVWFLHISLLLHWPTFGIFRILISVWKTMKAEPCFSHHVAVRTTYSNTTFFSACFRIFKAITLQRYRVSYALRPKIYEYVFVSPTCCYGLLLRHNERVWNFDPSRCNCWRESARVNSSQGLAKLLSIASVLFKFILKKTEGLFNSWVLCSNSNCKPTANSGAHPWEVSEWILRISLPKHKW